METDKCNNCSVDLGDEFYGMGKNSEIFCEECYESHWESAVMVYEFDPEYETLLRSDYAYTLDKSRSIEDGDEYSGPPTCIETAAWKSTDAWRGYVNVELADEYECIANGWSTGSYDDVKWKWDFNEFFENIAEGNLVPPVPVWFIFAQTSNVLSTATDVVVRNHQVGTFLNWLADETGMTREQLKTALS